MTRLFRAIVRRLMRPLIAVLEDLFETPADVDFYRPDARGQVAHAALTPDSDYLPREGTS